jgi:hypothetical protein
MKSIQVLGQEFQVTTVPLRFGGAQYVLTDTNGTSYGTRRNIHSKLLFLVADSAPLTGMMSGPEPQKGLRNVLLSDKTGELKVDWEPTAANLEWKLASLAPDYIDASGKFVAIHRGQGRYWVFPTNEMHRLKRNALSVGGLPASI